MPYLGLKDGDPIKPIEAHPDATIECPSCGGKMGVRQSHYKENEFVPTHFFHYSNSEGCTGESAAHYMMKSVAAERLDEMFTTATVELEVGIGDRVADVCAAFDEPLKPYGKGLIVEAQHNNKDKNIGQVAREYFEHGWSVYWAYLSDFEDDDLEISEERLWTIWPEKLPDRSGLEGYPECVSELMSRQQTAETVTPKAVIPTAYFQDFALEILSPTQVTAPGWTVHEQTWLDSEGDRVSWLNLLEAPNKRRYLELWVQDTADNWHDHVALPLTSEGVERLYSFAQRAETVDESDAKPSGEWWTLTTIQLPGYEGGGNLRISGAPNGDLVLQAERLGRRENRYGVQTAWRPDMGASLGAFVSAVSHLSW
jgi:hypothetical protein